jgi:hypothetical protein
MTNQRIRPASALAIFRDIESRDNDMLDTSMMLRDILCDSDEPLTTTYCASMLDDALLAYANLDRETLTALRLEYSLCPLHATDYAICFDDDDPDCEQIRLIHPSHDTGSTRAPRPFGGVGERMRRSRGTPECQHTVQTR